MTAEVDDGELLGLENGDLGDNTPYTANRRRTLDGRLIVFVRPGAKATVRLSSPGSARCANGVLLMTDSLRPVQGRPVGAAREGAQEPGSAPGTSTVVPRRTSRDIRSDSRLDVLHAVLSAGETTRNAVAQSTGLSAATVVTVVGELLAEGIIEERKVTAGRIGRPTSTLGMNKARGFVVGIDVAETYVRAVMFDAALNEIVAVESARDEHVLDPDSVVEGIGGTLDSLLEEAGVSRTDVLGVGVALPGLIQGPQGVSVVVPHWTWQTVELERLRERVGLPLVIENPLKSIATAELWLGGGRNYSSLATINLGTGVGAGIVLEGRILRGATNTAGEWGHTPARARRPALPLRAERLRRGVHRGTRHPADPA